MERKTIKENFLTIDSLNGSLDDLIKFLMERKSFYTSLGYKNIEIQSSYSEMYGVANRPPQILRNIQFN